MILKRKERERRLDDGVFLWGIGTSLRPSLKQLLELEDSPRVLFTPMVSPAASRDISPDRIVRWRTALGFDGRPYRLPPHSVVTSGLRRSRHYALVCRSEVPLAQNLTDEWLDETCLRNLRTGRPVGSSQVTSIVTRVPDHPTGRLRYRVAFQATLIYPFFVELIGHEDVEPQWRVTFGYTGLTHEPMARPDRAPRPTGYSLMRRNK